VSSPLSQKKNSDATPEIQASVAIRGDPEITVIVSSSAPVFFHIVVLDIMMFSKQYGS